jgi:hypothetical protein
MNFIKLAFVFLLMLKPDETKLNQGILKTSSTSTNQESIVSFHDRIIVFASKEQAALLLAQSDEFTQNLSTFDLQARLKTSKKVPTETDYLNQIGKYAQEWTKKEKRLLIQTLADIEKRLSQKSLQLSLPDTIYFAKTNGKDEGGAAYTRRNLLILNKKHLNIGTITHELFHVYSRHNPAIRDAAYQILGFEHCAPLTFTGDLAKQKITNPDAVILQHYLPLFIDNEQKKLMMITYSNSAYTGGDFFKYLNKGLLEIEQLDSLQTIAREIDGQQRIVNFNEAPNLERYIGRNTAYNIHPEEISAEHFKFILLPESNLPNQDLVDQLEQVIRVFESN